jgi:hypothetical protein
MVDVDTRLLRAFVSVAEELNFTDWFPAAAVRARARRADRSGRCGVAHGA